MNSKENKNIFKVILFVISVMLITSCAPKTMDESDTGSSKMVIRYSVYPYLPDMNYYIKTIEDAWAGLDNGVTIQYSDYDCYIDGEPEEVDVVMYDVVLLSKFIKNDYLLPISEDEIENIDDFYPFTLNDQKINGELYGIPSFLCGSFMIYDKNNGVFESANSIADLASEHDILMIDYELSEKEYFLEAYADIVGDGSVVTESEINIYSGTHENVDDPGYWMDKVYDLSLKRTNSESVNQLATDYEEGVADAYIGFSETMRFIESRIEDTAIKQISFSGKENTPLFYADIVGLTKNVTDEKRELCIKLANIMASGEVMLKLSYMDEKPQYLLMPRISVNNKLAENNRLYETLRDMAQNENNELFIMGSNYDEMIAD